MSNGDRQIRLGVSMAGIGYHASAWRVPGAPHAAEINFDFYRDMALTAERGLFDMVFLADYVGVRMNDKPRGYFGRTISNMRLEPMTLLSALAPATRHVGLAATMSTTFQHPYHIARSFASLDHLSGGRSAWNVVTSFQDDEARNFDAEHILNKASRYERALEAVQVACGLWDSWDADAFLRDPESGIYFDPAKLHVLHHRGKHFSVRGPLNMPRPPQGRPIIVQAGASEDGLDLAARTADVVYAAHSTLADAVRAYEALKGRLPRYGRPRDSLKIMPGILPILGETRAEAQAKYRMMQDAIDPVVGLGHLCNNFGDLSGYDLDGPVPDPKSDMTEVSRTDVMLQMARRENLTIRQLYERTTIGNAHHVVIGTAADVADVMEEWMAAGAADGFNILPAVSPGSLVDFVDMAVPELQRRGLFRTAYEGTTLRENLGLAVAEQDVRAAE